MRKGRSESFSPAYRLLKRREFLSLSRQGRRIQDSSFVVVFQNGQSGHSRLGVTVSKRVGNAVTRNRLKRLIREFFRKNRQSLEQNWDINVIAKPVAARLASHEVDAALNRLFSKFKAG